MPELKIDPHKSWFPLREKADETENLSHKKLLNEVANHMEAEIKEIGRASCRERG